MQQVFYWSIVVCMTVAAIAAILYCIGLAVLIGSEFVDYLRYRRR